MNRPHGFRFTFAIAMPRKNTGVGEPPTVCFCQRHFLFHENMQQLLAGSIDGFAPLSGPRRFIAKLSLRDTARWRRGCAPAKAVSRGFESLCDSDLTFLEKCRRDAVRPIRIHDSHTWHLAHLVAWHGILTQDMPGYSEFPGASRIDSEHDLAWYSSIPAESRIAR
jgi:hypothetical protein